MQFKDGDDYTVIGPDTKVKKAIAKIKPTLDELPLMQYPNRSGAIFSPAWSPFGGVAKVINRLSPDVVHLHWICRGMLRVEDISKIKAPIIWSLHDMWAFTGGCHYDGECGRYRKQCGRCPLLGSSFSNDLSRKLLSRKQKSFSKKRNIILNGTSGWLADCAKSSTLLAHHKIVNLPTPININRFKPLSKRQSREILEILEQKQQILFGAMSATIDYRKGYKELIEALKYLQRKDIELMVFGSSKPEATFEHRYPTHYLGYMHDDISLRILYSAADVMVVPSLQENLSNCIMEALACGTPVVAFDVGGNKDMVVHKKNGYLAKPFEPQDLAKGIEWVLNHPEPQLLARNARDKIVREFDSKIIAQKYIELYKEVLNQ